MDLAGVVGIDFVLDVLLLYEVEVMVAVGGDDLGETMDEGVPVDY